MSKQKMKKAEADKQPAKQPGPMEIMLQRIKLMLAAEPELLSKLVEALGTQHFFITVSFQKRIKPDDPHDLQHFYLIKGYPPNDVPRTLDHLLNEWLAKNDPTAQLKKDGNWH